MATLFLSTEINQLLCLTSDINDLMQERNEVNSRVEMYRGSLFLRALKYQDIIGQEKRVLMDLWNKEKELHALKPQCFVHPGGNVRTGGVLRTLTLEQLHGVVQAAIGWDAIPTCMSST